jgi:hypothetical protein
MIKVVVNGISIPFTKHVRSEAARAPSEQKSMNRQTVNNRKYIERLRVEEPQRYEEMRARRRKS